MLNIEKYKDNIKALGITRLALQNGEMKMCKEIECHNCDFYYDPDQMCFGSKIDWLCEEHKEPEIDWDNDIDWERVPADTPVIVGDMVDDGFEGYFATYLQNAQSKYFTFSGWKKKNDAVGFSAWTFCELANPEDIEKYRKKV